MHALKKKLLLFFSNNNNNLEKMQHVCGFFVGKLLDSFSKNVLVAGYVCVCVCV